MCHRRVLGCKRVYFILKMFFLCPYILATSNKNVFAESSRKVYPKVHERNEGASEPRESSSGFVLETYLILERELVKRVIKEGINVEEYAALVMSLVSQILQQLQPPGSIVLTALETNIIGPDNYVVLMNDSRVDTPKTLENLRERARSSSEMQRADVTILLVGRDMAHMRPDGMVFESYGLTYTGAACTTYSVIVAADNRKKYTGAMSVAHEIGHLLGSSHDGAESLAACPPDAGTIMSPQAGGEIRPRFSECSRRAISAFLADRLRAKCLFEESAIMPTTTPTDVAVTTAVLTTADEEQHEKKKRRKCKKFMTEGQYLLHFEMAETNITCNIICTAASNASDKWRVYAVVAPDGIPCDKSDPNKVCKKGVCR
ncbi:venom metalloproteinase antarease-like TpachMP_B isoform X1 [Dermacentor silvarum]|uniref:venom metalloproteinase antarease-like TpachMP_B isoform X1 n=1 Tax=Dermacentor silvarum TaxID=543639 RepID=UPI002101C1C0|nr:venom metalloproteinase antarease-like TpachMP_B isoform X1 [Dermacentor silvarum]